MSGLRRVRTDEEVRVKAGEHAGRGGIVRDVGTIYAVVEFGDTDGEIKTVIVNLDDMVRIVTSQIDKEIDSPLAAAEFEQLGNELENLSDEVDAAILAEAERLARETDGIPEEIAKAIGLLPFVKPLLQKLGVDSSAANVLTSLASGFVTAAGAYGLAKDALEKLRR